MKLAGPFRFVVAALLSTACLAACSVEVEPGTVVVDQTITLEGDFDESQSAAEVPVEADSEPTSVEQVSPAQDRSVEAVSETFEEYRAALLDLDGERASRVVTQSTFAYYDRILDAGLNATPDELLDSIPLSDALGVLAMRAQLGSGLQDVSDGIALFSIGVDQGLVGDNVRTVQLDRFDIDGDQAFGVLQGVQAMRFEYVEGSWYFDLPFTTSFIDDNEDDFIRGLTGGSGGRSELYDLIALSYGTTWDELGAPVS